MLAYLWIGQKLPNLLLTYQYTPLSKSWLISWLSLNQLNQVAQLGFMVCLGFLGIGGDWGKNGSFVCFYYFDRILNHWPFDQEMGLGNRYRIGLWTMKWTWTRLWTSCNFIFVEIKITRTNCVNFRIPRADFVNFSKYISGTYSANLE